MEKYNKLENKLNNAYFIDYDEETKGLKLVDISHGFELDKVEIKELITGLIHHYENKNFDEVNQHQERLNYNRLIDRTNFYKPKFKSGYLILFKDSLSLNYKFSSTKKESNIEKRIEALNNVSNEGIEVIDVQYTKGIELLKEFLHQTYYKKRQSNNFYRLDSEDIRYFTDKMYENDFIKIYENKMKIPFNSIFCENCRKTITSYMSDYYYQCMSCRTTYCSEKCALEDFHYCRPN